MKAHFRKPLVFVFAALAGLASAAALYVVLVMRSGRGYCTERSFVPDMLAYKLDRLKRAESPRFVILSGSNAQACLDCEELSRRLEMDVVCAGVIQTIPVRFYRAMVEGRLGPGDILYLPLEVSHYVRQSDEVLSPFNVSVLLGLLPSAQKTLHVDELARLYVAKGLGWLQTVLPMHFGAAAPHPPEVADIRRRIDSGTCRLWVFKPLPRGDFESFLPAIMGVTPSCTPMGLFTREFLESFGELVRYAESCGARVILGNIVSYAYPLERSMPDFQRRLAGLGYPVCGRPEALMLPYCCFADGVPHCNEAGKRLFTREIADDLCRILGKPVPDRAGWPLVVFPPESGGLVRFEQPASCVGRPSFGEFILDRGEGLQTNVVSRVRVNGVPARFREMPHPAKNVLWVWWKEGTETLTVEVEAAEGRRLRLERVLMEPDPADEIAKITSVNDASSDFVAKGAGRFVCRAKNEKEAYLRVRIPNWKSNRHRLHLTLRGGEFLKRAEAGGYLPECRIPGPCGFADGRIRTCIALNESRGFVAEDGCAYAGVYFPPGTLNAGEEIRVEELSFERL